MIHLLFWFPVARQNLRTISYLGPVWRLYRDFARGVSLGTDYGEGTPNGQEEKGPRPPTEKNRQDDE